MATENINSRVNELLGSALTNLESKDIDGAIEDLKAAEVIDRANPVILYNLGVAYSRQGLHRTAIEYYHRILNLEGGFADVMQVRRLLAFAYIQLRNYDEAAVILSDLISKLPNDTRAMSMLGYCREKKNDFNGAIQAHRKIVELEPDNANAANSLAYLITVSGGNLTEAGEFVRKALTASPTNAAYLDTAGMIYLKRGQGELAKKFIKKAFEKAPQSPEIREHLNELLKLK